MITNQFRFRGELFDQYSPVVASQDLPGEDAYLAGEAKAREEIDKQLDAAGWKAQSRKDLNLSAAPRSARTPSAPSTQGGATPGEEVFKIGLLSATLGDGGKHCAQPGWHVF